MKNLVILLALSLSISPALADVMDGPSTDQDLQSLQDTVRQLREESNRKIQDYKNQVQAINAGLDALKKHNDAVQQALFGLSAPVAGNGNTTYTPQGVPVYKSQGKPLVGSVSEMSPIIDKLMPTALLKNDQWLTTVQKELKLNTTTQRLLATTKDALNYLLPYRGFGPSAEAGDLILNDTVKIKSLASARYVKQRIIDETHLQVMTAVMELASDINKPENLVPLAGLVGDAQANEIRDILLTHVNDSVPSSTWDVLEKQRRYKLLVKSVVAQDKVVSDITVQLNKYNKKSKLSMNTSKILEPVLAALSLTPNMIGPGAKMALTSYVMVTGGPEQDKLLKELYLDRSLQSRLNLIAEEAHTALDSYYTAMNTHNPVLYYASDALIGQMLSEYKETILN